jgi:hypothetical protein
MAEALVADDWSADYFRLFPSLSRLDVRKVRRYRPEDFATVLRLILASPDRDFVIDAHGTPQGLSMTLVGRGSVSAVRQSLVILMQLRQAREAIARAGDDLDAWRRILRRFRIPPQHASTVDEARERARLWDKALVDGLRVSSKQAEELLRLMAAVRAKDLRRIEFRSCNMGKEPESLREFRRFLGARHVGGPDLRNGFGYVNPSLSSRGVDVLGRRGAEIFTTPHGRLALRLDIKPGRVLFDAFCAADSEQAVRDWVAEHVMPKSSYRRGRLPIHVLETTPRTFARDPGYEPHIKHASQLWWVGRVYEEERSRSAKGTIWERAVQGP